MKLALIPPNNLLSNYLTDYHLLLPQNATSVSHSREYYRTYNKCRKRGDFLILDNGKAEGLDYDWDVILQMADMYKVNEVVLPDVIGDHKATMSAILDLDIGVDDPWAYMGVVQGTNFDENVEMIDWYLDVLDHGLIQTIGLPRHLLTTVGESPEYRAILAEYIRMKDKKVNIHLLGTNPEYITELRDCGHRFRLANVRGVDTSAPFNYAYYSTWVGRDGHIPRPEGYFDLGFADFSSVVVQQNVDTMTRWVHG